MKKSLLAVAAMGAFASAAQAQSSVTIYGIFDEGFQSGYQRMVTGNTGAITNQNTAGIEGGGESTNRLGFKGTEDLGGGTSVLFTLEVGVRTDGGSFFNTGADGNRQSFVGLKKNGLGTVTIGTQYTPIHEAVSASDAGNANNQNGNVIYDRTGGFGSASGQVVAGSGLTKNTSSGMAVNTSYTVRTSNALVLKSENISGLNLKALFSSGGMNSNTTTTTVDNQGWGLGADYTMNKLFVTAVYQSFINQTLGGGIFTQGYGSGEITPGVNSKDNQYYMAATYDFGILKGFAQYINRNTTSYLTTQNYIKRSAEQIGVRANLTPVIQAWASAGLGSINSGGSAINAAKFNGWQLGSDYYLSKRTNLYAIYGQTASSNAYYATAYATNTAASNLGAYNASSYAVGIRHTF